MSFAEELELAERGLLDEGNAVRKQLETVMVALAQHRLDLATQVIDGDDEVDRLYLETDTRILNLIALQAPVAKDLRLVSALLHSNLHLERIGDLCVNVAKFVHNDHDYPTDSPLMATLVEMGARAGDMVGTALQAFSTRAVDLAEHLAVSDDSIDRLNRSMLEHLRVHMADEDSFEWATKLLLVARYLERIGDHAVDIGEQTAFLVTGVFREFTDASRPDAPEG